MNGQLKSITLNTSQESWKLDLPADPVPAAPGAHGQPLGPPLRVHITTHTREYMYTIFLVIYTNIPPLLPVACAVHSLIHQ
jgi:hypothetical protein